MSTYSRMAIEVAPGPEVFQGVAQDQAVLPEAVQEAKVTLGQEAPVQEALVQEVLPEAAQEAKVAPGPEVPVQEALPEVAPGDRGIREVAIPQKGHLPGETAGTTQEGTD